MYELTIHLNFLATHAVTIQGIDEEPHEHDWQLVVHVAARDLDSDGVVCDFHVLEQGVKEAIAPLENANLNEITLFKGMSPTAENVVTVISQRIAPLLPARVLLRRVSLTEAPGCIASVVFKDELASG